MVGSCRTFGRVVAVVVYVGELSSLCRAQQFVLTEGSGGVGGEMDRRRKAAVTGVLSECEGIPKSLWVARALSTLYHHPLLCTFHSSCKSPKDIIIVAMLGTSRPEYLQFRQCISFGESRQSSESQLK